MKYLLFNITVFIALGYLIIGDKAPLDFDVTFEQVGATIKETVREKPKDKEAPKRPPEIKRVVETAPEPKVIETVAVQPEPKKAVAEPIKEIIEVEKPIAKKAPPVRVEPKHKEPIGAANVSPVEVKPVAEIIETEDRDQVLVDAKERSESLRQMAAEMEQMFAEKMTW